MIKSGKTVKLASIPLLALFVFGCGPEDNSVADVIGDEETVATVGLYAAITDTDDSDDNAAGSLKYKLSDSDENDLTAGAISVDILYPTNQDQDFSIGLYDTSNSTSNMVADVILKSDGRIVTRVAGSASNELSTTHTLGVITNFQITWDKNQGDAGEYSVYMNELLLTTLPFNNVAATAVAYFGLKLSLNTGVAVATSTVDNIAIYSDVDMTELVYEDNFENYVVDEVLGDEQGDPYIATQAIVAGTDSGDGDGENASEVTLANYEWDFSEVDGSGLVMGDKELQMSKESDNYREIVDGAYGTNAVYITQSLTSGTYGYHYTTMSGTTDPLAAIDGMISMDITFNIEDVSSISASGNDLQLLENTDSNKGWKMIISKSSSKPQFKLYNGSGSTSVSGTTVLDSHTYYHIAATYDNETAKIYVNGVLEGTEVITDYLANTKDGDKVYLGGGSNSSQKNLEGALDNVAFWTVTLTADEVAARATEFGF